MLVFQRGSGPLSQELQEHKALLGAGFSQGKANGITGLKFHTDGCYASLGKQSLWLQALGGSGKLSEEQTSSEALALGKFSLVFICWMVSVKPVRL